ncbi:hypothetical protein GCM10010345_92140 [Streptomyces canarius]|uniref:Uncharacterized protein n=1 Tax=Streptomyces canarius TaxID=285453 RepID=A0ABQ3DID4_9ACTN|nr:hypothetical protein GCM10010345_92140 [Streptomyces canarius]
MPLCRQLEDGSYPPVIPDARDDHHHTGLTDHLEGQTQTPTRHVSQQHCVYAADLKQVNAQDPAAYGGPRLARTVLDLAAADADAGVHLAERTRRLARVAAVDGRLHDRLLAAHLVARPPADGLDEQQWWEQAVVLVVRLVADEPAPETARLVDLVLGTCLPERAAQLEADVRTALGTPPPPALLEKMLPADAEQPDWEAKPLADWMRVGDWSPVLPARLLADWEPMLNAIRRLKPAGPSDPRTAPVLEPVRETTALDAEDLAEVAAARGPAVAAAALAAAEDAGADGYAMVLHRLVAADPAADPAAWTADVPAVLAALQLPELGAFYLAAAAVLADRPDALPDGALESPSPRYSMCAAASTPQLPLPAPRPPKTRRPQGPSLTRRCST